MSALRRPQTMLGLAIIAAFVLAAVFADVISPYDAREKVGAVFEAPSSSHWLGTDDGGYDVVSQLLTGAQVSLKVGFLAAFVATFIGGFVGVASGYYGGRVDGLLMRVTDYFLAIPDVPLMIVFAALFGRSLTNVIVIIAIIYWTSTARLVRSQVKSLRERVYVRRAESLGSGNVRIIARHIVPHVMPLIIANAVLMIATAVFAETYITFLGLGDPSLISWGKLIRNTIDAQAVLNDAWWAIIPPGLCVTVVVLACTLVGQSIEESLNPRLRAGHLSVRRFRVRPLRGRLEGE